jgi:hypothetical protein
MVTTMRHSAPPREAVVHALTNQIVGVVESCADTVTSGELASVIFMLAKTMIAATLQTENSEHNRTQLLTVCAELEREVWAHMPTPHTQVLN